MLVVAFFCLWLKKIFDWHYFELSRTVVLYTKCNLDVKQLIRQSEMHSVDIMGKIAHISIKKNRITIEIDLEPLAQLPSQPPTEDLNNNHHNDN
jgi:hypothetical protein